MTKPKPAPEELLDVIEMLEAHGCNCTGIATMRGDDFVVQTFRGTTEIYGPGLSPEELLSLCQAERKFDA